MSAKKSSLTVDGGSFRDPAGFVFKSDGIIYRQVNKAGQKDYEHFMSSGLYGQLAGEGLIVAHEEVNELPGLPSDPQRYKLLRPTPIPFISYPYEWSFSQVKTAAELTLQIQKRALEHGMILKDASAYNVQFFGRRPLFIDTLSFRIYEPGAPWDGYRQFCEHFIAPLAVGSYGSADIFKMLRSYLDGLPLSVAVDLLPGRARFRRGLAMHLYIHSASRKRYDNAVVGGKDRKVSAMAMTGLISSLEATVRRLKQAKQITQWGQYYEDTNYTARGFADKKKIVGDYLKAVRPQPKIVWDVGANDGTFSEIAATAGAYVCSFDIDLAAVEKNIHSRRDGNIADLILPLVQDLTNPSPALGWGQSERLSLYQRGPADVIIALALIHHLAIAGNLPLPSIAENFATLGRHIIIEFVPREDSKAQILLRRRANQFSGYTPAGFEVAFSQYFQIVKKSPVRDSQRVIYLLKAKV